MLLQLFKSPGSLQDINCHRNIHTKVEVPKLFVHIITTAANVKMIEKVMSKYQIGTKPGHRAQEHFFVLKSVIGMYEQGHHPSALGHLKKS